MEVKILPFNFVITPILEYICYVQMTMANVLKKFFDILNKKKLKKIQNACGKYKPS